MAVFVKSIAFSELKQVTPEDATLTAEIEWTDGVKGSKEVFLSIEDDWSESKKQFVQNIARGRLWEYAKQACAPEELIHRTAEIHD